ncbi:sporulation thiol-disulfide oxidoreductase A precursor [mine drainage metagenome]|uniref:Sporulation thiol-disulfide oxidoreductase A n=1 Tax=mine drainage metagenome TaxID=410659 RepID=A0A1J5RQM7_9ZZZZ
MTNDTGSKPRKAKWRNLAVNILLFVVVVAGIRTWQHRDMISGAAPALQGVTLSGQPYVLPAHPAQPVLVHFWGTWCPICRAEQNSIVAIAHDHPNIITVAMQSGKPEEVARYMREQGIDFPVMNDPDGSISSAWGVHAVPASFIIAPDGKIRFVEVGYTTGPGLRLRLWLAGII